MKTVAIVCNGSFPRTEYPLYLLRSADFVVCCDGALQTLEKKGIVPDVVVGDMDSVCGRALKRFHAPRGARPSYRSRNVSMSMISTHTPLAGRDPIVL